MKHAASSLSLTLKAKTVAAFCLGVGMTCLSAAAQQQVLLVGNSLTHHGPSAAVQWVGDWGMAASAADKDYAAQLGKLLPLSTKEADWRIRKESALTLELAPVQYQVSGELAKYASQARLVVIQAGDNVDVNKIRLPDFAQSYERAAMALRPARGTLACISTWWPSAEKDKLIQAACTQAGGVFVNISDLAKVPANYARSERFFGHDGVASHPGDAGMKAIAQRIVVTLQTHSRAWRKD